jgi:hypothetical protein
MTESSNHPPALHQLSECLEGAEDRGAFERLKAQAELQYRRTRTFAATLDTQEGRQEATAELVLLVRGVFLGYLGLRGRMNQAATDAALMVIIDYYFDLYLRRDHQPSDAEEATVKGQMRWMVISSSRGWEQHLAELRNLSTNATTSAVRAPAKGRNGASEAPQETAEDRSARRYAVLKNGWTRGRLVTQSAVGKATVYGYFDGSRKTIKTDNRRAIADTLEIELKDLPT